MSKEFIAGTNIQPGQALKIEKDGKLYPIEFKGLTTEDRILKIEILMGISEIPKAWKNTIASRISQVRERTGIGLYHAREIIIKKFEGV